MNIGVRNKEKYKEVTEILCSQNTAFIRVENSAHIT